MAPQAVEGYLADPRNCFVKHLEENIASASLELPQATYKKLAAVRPSYASLRD